ncbi:RNA polymerase sigma factor (sigma-70 family) [Catalinimonas alkaloidigena]|uniref:sigma-70 family RNA polymerase sigma factor n=1 Tax=Catalinimonas alkaloidigena TaxID=1075417 RepID=UPI002404D85D|nr:sigma-70 family RNA polymerase sigma factor [Catalinimonas alkaloidigena]MDF9794975.1 RNA polymerase sigma factor (sigma-70 family) [Catalinimonas alkaloidigena]
MATTSTDNRIIQHIQKGNEGELVKVYQNYRMEFIHWAQKTFHCSEEVAKDAYQVGFLIFYDNVLSGKVSHVTSSIKTYLFAIGKNKLFEQHRHEMRYCHEVKDELLGYDKTDNDILESEENFRQLETGLEKLGSPCKDILEMMYYEKRSVDYITEKLGYKNSETTKNQKYKCMQRLKKLVVKTKLS